MSLFNPLPAPLPPATPARQIARSQALRKNTAAEGDRVDHQVESAEELSPAGDQAGGGNPQSQQRRQQTKDDGKPHIDVKA